MATMADVANKAGVSRATVSIVLNGKQKERKIPEETCEKVWQAVKELQYHPNVSARRIHHKEVTITALFVPQNFENYYLGRFLSGSLERVFSAGYGCEVVVRLYTEETFEENIKAVRTGRYNSAVFIGLSSSQQKHLEENRITVPVVLINRSSEVYSTVNIDNELLAKESFKLLQSSGELNIGILQSKDESGEYMRERLFLKEAEAHGVHIKPEMICHCENSMHGGRDAISWYLSLKEKPGVIYCDADYISLGFAAACEKNGIHIPEDVRILTIGVMNPDLAEYCSSVALTTLFLPAEKMAAEAIDMIMRMISESIMEPVHVILHSEYHKRSSF